MKSVKRNSWEFGFILSNIQSAKVIGGGDPRLLTTVKSVVQACQDNNFFKLYKRTDGKYEIKGSSCSWECTF